MPETLERRPSSDPGRPARVAIIDDSVSVCKAVERMLAPRGGEVVAIHSGEEALERLEAERPELVICDLILPDLEGLAVCRFVRESRGLARVPLLAISGLATDEVRRQALKAGADAVLKKPFRSDLLLAKVDELLARGHGAEAPPPPPPPQAPEPVLGVISELEACPGLVAGSWWLANGAEGRLRKSAAAGSPDPETMLARLRSFAAQLGIRDPEMVLLEGSGGELLLIGHRDRRGVVCLHLGESAVLGKARYLARKFLRLLDPPPPAPAELPTPAGQILATELEQRS